MFSGKNALSVVSCFTLLLSLPTIASQAKLNSKDNHLIKEHTMEVVHVDENGKEIVSTIEVQEKFGKIIRDGDIIVGYASDFYEGGEEQKNRNNTDMTTLASQASSKIWPQSVIPYSFSTAYTNAEKSKVLAVLSQMSINTGLQFVPRTNQSNYVNFIYTSSGDHAAGRSYVGMQGGKQNLELNKSSGFRTRTITHEMGHAIGYEHEHQRPDRDTFISVNYPNLNDCRSSFNIKSDLSTNKPYDIDSVMHYGSITSGSCVHDDSEPLFTNKSGNIVYGSSTLTAQDTSAIADTYGHFESISNFNWQSDLCLGYGIASWGAMPGASYYVVEYKNGFNWYTLTTTTETTSYEPVPRAAQVRVVGVNSAGERSANSNQDYARYYNVCY
ncbi:M12 family metallopeptidase [Salinimonas chungwhensis]|uniref:M12 family metallopeptidase n=1 Tax=Salinimonas chungwhensis TaxID=265425 RepID=UPI0003618BD8|nr:M12 family metallopeptidase [Salinimonas chungwhensis]